MKLQILRIEIISFDENQCSESFSFIDFLFLYPEECPSKSTKVKNALRWLSLISFYSLSDRRNSIFFISVRDSTMNKTFWCTGWLLGYIPVDLWTRLHKLCHAWQQVLRSFLRKQRKLSCHMWLILWMALVVTELLKPFKSFLE